MNHSQTEVEKKTTPRYTSYISFNSLFYKDRSLLIFYKAIMQCASTTNYIATTFIHVENAFIQSYLKKCLIVLTNTL